MESGTPFFCRKSKKYMMFDAMTGKSVLASAASQDRSANISLQTSINSTTGSFPSDRNTNISFDSSRLAVVSPFTPLLPGASPHSSSQCHHGNGGDQSVRDIFKGLPKEMYFKPKKVSGQPVTQRSRRETVRLRKETLSDVQVLGQSDCKFIVCYTRKSASQSSVEPMILIFDQHAVDERIWLESVTSKWFSSKGKFDHVAVNQSITVKLSGKSNESLIEKCPGVFLKFGLKGKALPSQGSMVITAVPEILLKSCSNDVSSLQFIGKLEQLVRYILEAIESNCSATAAIPPVLFQCLASRACHGAIRFGDKLTTSQCQNLIRKLRHCDLPFQCAHGRPCVAPITSLPDATWSARCRHSGGRLNFSRLLSQR